MARVLVVDDEPGIRTALVRGLGAEGMEVEAVGDGHAALSAAVTGGFDVIVLDIILPGLSGYRVLERLRAAGVDTPVLLLSAKDGEFDQADGLDLGADGYLVKPFAFVVLVAQLKALLRRRDAALGRTGQRVRLGALVVDPVARAVSWDGAAVELSPREFALLHALASRPGHRRLQGRPPAARVGRRAGRHPQRGRGLRRLRAAQARRRRRGPRPAHRAGVRLPGRHAVTAPAPPARPAAPAGLAAHTRPAPPVRPTPPVAPAPPVRSTAPIPSWRRGCTPRHKVGRAVPRRAVARTRHVAAAGARSRVAGGR